MGTKGPWLAKALCYHSPSSMPRCIQLFLLQYFLLKPSGACCSSPPCMVSVSTLLYLECLSHRSMPSYILHMLPNASRVTDVSQCAIALCVMENTVKILAFFMSVSICSFCCPLESLSPLMLTHTYIHIYVYKYTYMFISHIYPCICLYPLFFTARLCVIYVLLLLRTLWGMNYYDPHLC